MLHLLLHKPRWLCSRSDAFWSAAVAPREKIMKGEGSDHPSGSSNYIQLVVKQKRNYYDNELNDKTMKKRHRFGSHPASPTATIKRPPAPKRSKKSLIQPFNWWGRKKIVYTNFRFFSSSSLKVRVVGVPHLLMRMEEKILVRWWREDPKELMAFYIHFFLIDNMVVRVSTL